MPADPRARGRRVRRTAPADSNLVVRSGVVGLESAVAASLPRAARVGADAAGLQDQEDVMDKKAKVPKKAKSTAAGKGKADTAKK